MYPNKILDSNENLNELCKELAILELQLEASEQKTLILEQIIKIENEIAFIEKELS